jgi:hypothetical protein
VVVAVDQRRLEVDHREAGQHAGLARGRQALLDAGNEFLGDRAADHLVLETVARARRARLEHDLQPGKLARAAGLLLVGVVDLRPAAERLAIGDLRSADIGIDLVGAAQDVDLDLEMELAHALDNGLTRLRIGRDTEGRILLDETAQRLAHLLLVGLRLRLDGELDDRIGEVHLFQDHRIVRIAQRVAGGDALEAGQGDDVAGTRFLHVLTIVGVHQQHAADALLAVLGAVQHAGRRFEHARIDAGEGERAHERVGHDLEGERGKRRVVARRQRDRLVGAHLHALDVGHVDRRRQVVDDGVEHGLHALVLERRAAQHRNERVGDRALADAFDQRVVVRLLAGQVFLERRVVLLDGHLDHLVAPFGRLFLEVGRNLDDLELGASALFEPDDRLVEAGRPGPRSWTDANRHLRDQRLAAGRDHVDGAPSWRQCGPSC